MFLWRAGLTMFWECQAGAPKGHPIQAKKTFEFAGRKNYFFKVCPQDGDEKNDRTTSCPVKYLRDGCVQSWPVVRFAISNWPFCRRNNRTCKAQTPCCRFPPAHYSESRARPLRRYSIVE